MSVLGQVQGLIQAQLSAPVREVCRAVATLSGEVVGGLLGAEERGREGFVFVFFKGLY